jgi:oligopeptidase A
MNPLLDFSGLPRFDAVRSEHVAPAIRQLIAENKAVVAKLSTPESQPSWDAFMQPLTDAGERLGRAWGIVGHLHSVMDIPAWRDAYNAMLPEITGYYAELGQNEAIYAKVKALRASAEYETLTPTRRRIVDNDLRDFRLSGAELPEGEKPRFKAIQEEMSGIAAKFSENLLDATNAHVERITDEAQLTGIPEDVKAAAKQGDAWELTLRAPCYIPVMQYAEDRGLRARMYRAYATRASEFGRSEWNNGPLITRLLHLRAEEAGMLGYTNFAEVSLVPKMAESTSQVAGFLRELAARARPFAERDVAELREFARAELGMDKLESWDLAWASEKLKQARYAFSDEEVKQYFPEHKVMAGLFKVIETLFSVNIEPDTAPTWHADVRFYRIVTKVSRGGTPAGTLVGRFYVDLYARETKRGGAWMADAIGRRQTPGGIQTPVAYLNCNFPAPVNQGTQMRPATFSHDDVLTLFHETGHGLHHLLTRVEDLPVSGIDGVEWDAVELPSQFMENFCWEWDVLSNMTAHVDTGEPLPRALYDKMIAAKNFQSGMQTLRQIEFALFDLLLHTEFDPAGTRTVQDVILDVRREVAVVFPPEWNRFPQSFSHIFGGGYAAGYYSYKWAEVLSADAYSAFEEAAGTRGSALDAETGERFWREILAVGGSRPAMESFKAFRGREPEVDALLRHNGMVEV